MKQVSYDSRGRRTSATDGNSKVTQYTYDDADRLIQVTDASQHSTGYAYDTEGNLSSITDALGRQTSFNYDTFRRVTKTTFPSTLIETYTYDAVGNLLSKTDRKGNTISYAYDALNRLTTKTYPGSAAVTYTYDLDGRLTQVSDSTGTYQFSYDHMGRLTGTTTSYSFLTARTFTNSYSYDAASNRVSFTDPENGQNTYSYDTVNRLTNLTNFQSQSFGFSYDNLSRRTQLTRPNGVNTNYAYDSLSRLLSVLHQVGSTTLDGASYTYDNAGNRTSKTDVATSVTSNYGYDNIYQLLSVMQGGQTAESYTYDATGNRLSTMSASPYAYNSSNQLSSTPSASYTYDNNGNTLTKVASSATTSYVWDFENRLTSVTLPGTGGTVSFKYDPMGRRIQKSSSNGTTNYLYDGRNLLEELDASGNVLARYNQGPSIDEPISELRGSTTSYYQVDFLGSVTSLSNSAGALANTYTYDSFGKLIGSTGTLTNPFQFTGREFDPETGIYNYRFRYYDQNVGRFLSEDPIMFGGGVNFFRYADGNPVSEADPLGLDTKVCYYSDAAAGFGHVGFGLPQEGEQGTQGFYPTGNPIDSPGKVKPDEQKKPQCKTIPAPKDKDQCMFQCRLRRVNNPGNYKVTSRQCTSFVRECLRECGEPAGDYNGPRPWPFFDGLPK